MVKFLKLRLFGVFRGSSWVLIQEKQQLSESQWQR